MRGSEKMVLHNEDLYSHSDATRPARVLVNISKILESFSRYRCLGGGLSAGELPSFGIYGEKAQRVGIELPPLVVDLGEGGGEGGAPYMRGLVTRMISRAKTRISSTVQPIGKEPGSCAALWQ